MRSVPPPRDGVSPSWIQLPPGPWATVLEALCALFPAVGRDRWRDRIARGLVADSSGRPVTDVTPFAVGLEVSYYREVPDEPRVAAEERIVHADSRLLVADKPPGLPVTPSGAAVSETLLARLVRRTGNRHLVPLHRIDRDTSGLVMFSTEPDSRPAYQALFRDRAMSKTYHALAAPLPALEWPHTRRSRIEQGEPFFRMREVPGDCNAETRIMALETGDAHWRYQLEPVTGRKHQLRVHMAALGAPILGDRLYPELQPGHASAHAPTLKLLAASLAFVDPVDGAARTFASEFSL